MGDSAPELSSGNGEFPAAPKTTKIPPRSVHPNPPLSRSELPKNDGLSVLVVGTQTRTTGCGGIGSSNQAQNSPKNPFAERRKNRPKLQMTSPSKVPQTSTNKPRLFNHNSNHSSPAHSRPSSPATSLSISSRDTSPVSTAQPFTATTNRIHILNHVAGADNPLHLARILRQANLKITIPQQYFSFKKQSTLLVFTTTDQAQLFTDTIPASPTFGPRSTYENPPQLTQAQQPKKPQTSRPPRHEVVVRGVSPDINVRDFLEELPISCPCKKGFSSIQRILSKEGQPTGLVRLFTACQPCSSAALSDGITLLGRTYKVEPSKNQLIRPCSRCHDYGHDPLTCRKTQLCRVCGDALSGRSPCSHAGHDPSKPYCVTCNKYGHFTGQRVCPRYPKDQQDLPPQTFIPAPTPVTNPWKMKVSDFPTIAKPALTPATPISATDPVPTDDQPPTTDTQVPPPPPSQAFVTLDVLNSFLEELLSALSEGFKRTFDTLLTIFLSTVPAQSQASARQAANRITKKAFDMRTIFQSVGKGLSVLHSNSKRNDSRN